MILNILILHLMGIFNMIFENNEKKRSLKELLIDKINEGSDYFENIL